MSAFAGRQAIIEIDSAPVAAINTKNLEINNELIDISSDDSGDWVQKLESIVASKSVSISCSGVMSDTTLMTLAMNSDPSATIEFQFPTDLEGATTGPIISGTFLIASFSNTGENADKFTFDASFESSGTVTLTAGV